MTPGHGDTSERRHAGIQEDPKAGSKAMSQPVARRVSLAAHAFSASLIATYGLVYIAAATRTPLATVAPASALLACGLLAASLIDQRSHRIPNPLTLALAVGGIAAAWWLTPGEPGDRFLACGAGFGAFAAVILLYRHLRGRDGMGWGDAKLFGAAGAWVGTAGLLTVLLWACLTALAAVLVLHIATGAMDRATRIPFGPHLAFGTWLVWLFGPLI